MTKNLAEWFDLLSKKIDWLRGGKIASTASAEIDNQLTKIKDLEGQLGSLESGGSNRTFEFFLDNGDRQRRIDALKTQLETERGFLKYFYDQRESNPAGARTASDADKLAARLKELEATRKAFEESYQRRTTAGDESAKATTDAWKQVYGELKFEAAGYYDYRVKQIASEAAEMQKAGVSTVTAGQWQTAKLKELDDDLRQYESGGMEKGLARHQEYTALVAALHKEANETQKQDLAELRVAIDGYQSAMLEAATEEEQALFRLEAQYDVLREQVDEYYTKLVALKRMSAEEATDKEIADLKRLDDAHDRAVKGIATAHRKGGAEMEKIWDNTRDSMMGITRDWLAGEGNLLKSMGSMFKNLLVNMVNNWLWSMATMQQAGNLNVSVTGSGGLLNRAGNAISSALGNPLANSILGGVTGTGGLTTLIGAGASLFSDGGFSGYAQGLGGWGSFDTLAESISNAGFTGLADSIQNLGDGLARLPVLGKLGMGGTISGISSLYNLSQGNYAMAAIDAGITALYAVNPVLGAAASVGKAAGEFIVDLFGLADPGKTTYHNGGASADLGVGYTIAALKNPTGAPEYNQLGTSLAAQLEPELAKYPGASERFFMTVPRYYTEDWNEVVRIWTEAANTALKTAIGEVVKNQAQADLIPKANAVKQDNLAAWQAMSSGVRGRMWNAMFTDAGVDQEAAAIFEGTLKGLSAILDGFKAITRPLTVFQQASRAAGKTLLDVETKFIGYRKTLVALGVDLDKVNFNQAKVKSLRAVVNAVDDPAQAIIDSHTLSPDQVARKGARDWRRIQVAQLNGLRTQMAKEGGLPPMTEAEYNTKLGVIDDAFNFLMDDIRNGADGVTASFKDLTKSIKEYSRHLLTGDKAPGGMRDNYLAAKNDLRTTAAKARRGDKEAASNLTAAADTFLTASKHWRPDEMAYNLDFGWVMTLLNSSAGALAAAGNLTYAHGGGTIGRLRNDEGFVTVNPGETILTQAETQALKALRQAVVSTPAAGSGADTQAVVAEVSGMRRDMKVVMAQIERHSKAVARLIKQWDINGPTNNQGTMAWIF